MMGGKPGLGQYTERRRDLRRFKKLVFIAKHPLLEIACRVAGRELEKAQTERSYTIRALAHLAHDINNALAAMAATADLLRFEARGSRMPDEPRENALRHLGILSDGCHRIEHITYSAIELTAAESGRIEVDSTPFDAVEQSRRIVGHMNVLAKKNGLVLDFEAGGPAQIMSDHRLFDRVLSNLISNALKYTKEGSVTVSVATEGAEIKVKVKDTGPGIGGTDIRAIFDEHYRGRDVAGISGKGLGLYIAKSYTELMGGRISVESELGRGSTFILSFPQAQQ